MSGLSAAISARAPSRVRRGESATSRTYFHSAYLDEFPEAADKIGAFLTRPQTVPHIEAAFFMVTDPRLQQLLSDAIYLD